MPLHDTNLLFKTLTGSRLYGCFTKNSDYDYKGIHFQTLQQLLDNTSASLRSNNIYDDEETDHVVEFESYSLNYYMHLLGNGQVIPMDMLFAPKEYWLVSSPTWELIQQNRKEFVSRNITPFVGYAKSQAIKYGLKGTKLQTLDTALELISENKSFDYLCYRLRHMEGVELEEESILNTHKVKHITICGKTFGETTDYSLWLPTLHKLRSSFGKRAEAAMFDGVDLKAQYHTVRICKEATELLLHGTITFPRPEVDILNKIRNVEFTKPALASLVEECFNEVKEAEKISRLKETPNITLMKSIVHKAQSNFITSEFLDETKTTNK